jgi:hypothetical protein
MPPRKESDMSEIAVHRELASLQTTVEHLNETLSSMTSQWARQEEIATAGRKALHEKFEAVRMEFGVQISALSLRVDRIVDTMKDVEPAVKSFRDEKLRQEGAKKLGATLWAAMMAIAGVVGWGLHEFIGYLKH